MLVVPTMGAVTPMQIMMLYSEKIEDAIHSTFF